MLLAGENWQAALLYMKEEIMKRVWKKTAGKVVAGILCTLLLCGNTASAEGTTEFHIASQSGKAGDTVTVPVEFHSGEEVGGFQISVYYDTEVMEYQSLEQGDLVVEEGGIFDYNPITDSGEIVIVYVVADTVKADGVVANITFTLKQDCGETLPMGMGVDQLIDSSEESNDLSGSQVTGGDETFQATVNERRAQEAQQSASEEAGQDASGQGEGSEDDAAAAGEAAGQDSADPGSGESAAEAENSAGQVPVTVLVVAATAALIVIIIIFFWRKKHNKTE